MTKSTHNTINRDSARGLCSALTIDVEDGLNIIMHDIFKKNISPTRRVVDNVMVLLDLFDEKRVKGTFFILGEIAKHYPDMVKTIALKGHEIGVHGYYHDQIFNLTPEKARKDINRAKELIEDVSGEKVYGFRAPAFSIFEKTSWIFEILAELGFRYDSSIVPVKTGRYGWPGFREDIQLLVLPGGDSIIEVPLSVTNIMGKVIPACGGGYLRYFPYSFTRMAFHKIQKKRPAILYLHPYELDTTKYPDYFYKAKSSLPLRRRIPLSFYRLHKGTVIGKLRRLMEEFHFMPINSILNDSENDGNIPITIL